MLRFITVSMVLITSALFVGCTKKPSDSVLAKAFKAAPNYAPVCEQIKAHVTQICGNDANCKLSTIAAVTAAMQVIDKSPQLQKSDVDMLNEFLKIEKPTRTDASTAIQVIARDCWSVSHVILWQGVLGAVKSKVKGLEKLKVQKLFRDRVILLDANVPAMIRVTIKFALLKDALAAGLFRAKKGSEKGIAEIDGKINAVRNAMTAEYAKLLANDKGNANDNNPENANFDPIAVSAQVKKELALAVALSREMNTWIAANLTE